MTVQLTPQISVSPQILPEDIPALAAAGFGMIINNRPDGESAGQPLGAAIEAAARAAGMSYVTIPVDQSGIDPGMIKAMADAMAAAKGPVLAYCRSGTRSTHLWALAAASQGADVVGVVRAAGDAGYDIQMMTPMLRQLNGAK